ncbi:8366_t:CDS:10, partial [Entrophospora sp. SA101]
MLHCVANDHEIVALANLKPISNIGKDELDSFLYQTVGHDAIEYYAGCMNLPLYRREIVGKSIVQEIDYRETVNDETEDLYELLKTVKESHPDIKAISVGAILSNYQRVRVENVCNRLGLISLAYLWRRNQKELLAEMIDSGLTAILIKVAAIGLEPSHLGKSIKELYPYLCTLNEKYDVHICGEGGEYETLTLDCPLFVKRIIIEETEIVTHSDDAFATVAYLRPKKLILKEKPANEIMLNPKLPLPNWKENLKETFELITNEGEKLTTQANIYTAHTNSSSYYCNISGTTAYSNKNHKMNLLFDNIEEETQACMLNIQTQLHNFGFGWSDVVNMNVFIKDMNEFVRMNSVYKRFFDINPPPRACVGCNLQSPVRIQIDLMAITSSPLKPRETMHVQSMSYWAPANIGPYSQATITKNHAYIAGQIGLIPSSLELPHTIEDQTLLSLKNLENVTSVLGLEVKRLTSLCICYIDDVKSFNFVKKAWKIFFNYDDNLVSKKDFTHPPTLFVVVPSLPRGSKVEWQVLVHDDKIDNEMILKKPSIFEDNKKTEFINTTTSVWFMCPIFSSVILIKLLKDVTLSILIDNISTSLNNLFEHFLKSQANITSDIMIFWNNISSIRIFYSENIEIKLLDLKKAISENSALGICVK